MMAGFDVNDNITILFHLKFIIINSINVVVSF